MIHYLGAKLFQHENNNIVSSKFTNEHFLNELNIKQTMLYKIDFNHEYISLENKIRLLKIFRLVYIDIFAQILDNNIFRYTITI